MYRQEVSVRKEDRQGRKKGPGSQISVSGGLWHGGWQHEKINVSDHLYVCSEIKRIFILMIRNTHKLSWYFVQTRTNLS